MSISYTVEDGVDEFLTANTAVKNLLSEAYFHINQTFQDATLKLSVRQYDDEIDQQLILSIITDLDPEIALSKLDEFDRSWWFEASHKVNGKLCILLGYSD